MTTFPTILIVEDEPDVAHALAATLASLERYFPVEVANSAEDAHKVIAHLSASARPLGLVLCDNLLPGQPGLPFLVELLQRPETARARKVLLTGQSSLDETLRTFPESGIDQCLAKPWDNRELVAVCKYLLTDFVIETVEDLSPFLGILETDRLQQAQQAKQAQSSAGNP